MAHLAARPPSRRPPTRTDARRPRRLAGLGLAAAAGLAVLGFGLVQAVGGRPDAAPTGSGGPSVAAATGSAAASTGPDGRGSGGSPGSSAPSASASPPVAVDPVAARAARLQATLDRLRVKLAIPGLSATILLPDGTSWTGVGGLAVVASQTPVTPETAFAFASVSKTFTSAVVLELVDEGRIHLTDRAADLLPGLAFRIDRRITVAMLLNHTSGLADYFLNPKIDGPLRARPSDAWPVTRTLAYVGRALSPPGVAWHYSNTNYLLLGLIVERVTARRLADAIRTRLLEPTGLGTIWFQAIETSRAPLADGYRFLGTKRTARPIDLADGSGVAPFRSVITAAGGAGSLAGTSADLARWGRALYGGDVLGPQGTALLLSGFTKTTGYLPGVAYGFGIQALTIDGHPSLGHSGRVLGFRSAIRHFPIDGITIAVLTNQSRADPGLIVRALLAVVAPPPVVVCPTCPPGPGSSSDPSASLPPASPTTP